jgi:hypothetical protein
VTPDCSEMAHYEERAPTVMRLRSQSSREYLSRLVQKHRKEHWLSPYIGEDSSSVPACGTRDAVMSLDDTVGLFVGKPDQLTWASAANDERRVRAVGTPFSQLAIRPMLTAVAVVSS